MYGNTNLGTRRAEGSKGWPESSCRETREESQCPARVRPHSNRVIELAAWEDRVGPPRVGPSLFFPQIKTQVPRGQAAMKRMGSNRSRSFP